jgi:predicted RNA-binding protein with TRAM domain
MDETDDLLCLFSAEAHEQGDTVVIEVPEREIDVGEIRDGETYRVGLFRAPSSVQKETPGGDGGHLRDRPREPPADEPPVEEGEVLDVEIEDMGDQGDGIARVGPGYIVFVPNTEIGERVEIEVTTVKESMAFGEVQRR